MAFSVCSNASLLHCVNQGLLAEAQHIEPQAIDAKVPTQQLITQTTEHIQNEGLFGHKLAHRIAEKIDDLSQPQLIQPQLKRWPSLFIPRRGYTIYNLQLSTQNTMLKIAEQLQQELTSLPGISQQPRFQQFNQHIQRIRLFIKNLIQCIQAKESMPFHTQHPQLMNNIIFLAKQWIFRISARYRQIIQNRWNIFIMFNATTHLPEVRMAISPQQILSTKSNPAQIMYFLTHLYLVLQSGCNTNLKAFMPNEEMFQEFITAYPPSRANYPNKNPFEIHTPLINCMYILIFSHIHNVGVQAGLTLCYQLLSHWKERIVQYTDLHRLSNDNYQQSYVPTICDLFLFVRFDAALPIAPWVFHPQKRRSLITTMCHLISETGRKTQHINKYMHNAYFIHDVITSYQQKNYQELPDAYSTQLIKNLQQNLQKIKQKGNKYRDDIPTLHHFANKTIYEAALIEENLCHTDGTPLCPYAHESSLNTNKQLYREHFYHAVFNYTNFALMLDLHDWNMQSVVQNASSEMRLHNEQKLHDFRSDISKSIILGLHGAKDDLVELQTCAYERYSQAVSPSYMITMNDTFINVLKTFAVHSAKTSTLSSYLLETCLCDLKALFDIMDPNKALLTMDFFENFFSADHYTCSKFNSWYPPRKQHVYQQSLPECSEFAGAHSKDSHIAHSSFL